MQRVNIACEHRAELACHRVDAGVYRGSSHRVFKRKRAGDAKRPQPREASGKIAEAFAEENAWSDEVRRRKIDQVNLLSTTSPPSSGCLRIEKRGNMDSSATAGSSNASVPGKNLLPAMPWAWAE